MGFYLPIYHYAVHCARVDIEGLSYDRLSLKYGAYETDPLNYSKICILWATKDVTFWNQFGQLIMA